MLSPPNLPAPDAPPPDGRRGRPASPAADARTAAPFADLCHRLVRAGVQWCALPPTPRAHTGRSLDVLVARSDATTATAVLAAAGFHRLQSRGGSLDVVDHLAADAHGELLHLGVFWSLPLRRVPAPSGHLPWEAAVLGSRRQLHAAGPFVPAAEVATLLQAVWSHEDRRAAPATADAVRLAERARELLGPAAAAALPDLDAAVARGLLAFPMPGRPPRPRARPAPATGGLVVAFVGCDGSGKSTVVADLERWLAPWFAVQHVYLGSGQGSSSLLRWPLLLVHRLLTRLRPVGPAAATADAPAAGGTKRGLRYRLRPIWALVLALEKRSKLRAAWRARARGAVVVCDRYPQNEIPGFNDGPLLADWLGHRSRWRRALAAWERRPYEWAQQHPPDLLVKLRVRPEVALARKPDMHRAEIDRRIAAVEQLGFGHATKTLGIDTEAPLASVLQQVRQGVFAEL